MATQFPDIAIRQIVDYPYKPHLCYFILPAKKLNSLPLLEHWQLKPQNPFFLILQLYKQQFLDLSICKGLIDPDHLALASDGTPVCTAASTAS